MSDIREIETGIHELNEIFRDLGTIVTEQQSMLGKYTVCSSYCKQLDSSARPDNIESNVNNIATDTERASEELTTARGLGYRANRGQYYSLLVSVRNLADISARI